MRRKAVREPEVKAEAVHGRAMRVQRADKVGWAVVKFNESTRAFNTGNVVKVVLPSAKDLDAVAEEERIKWLTRKK